MASLTIDKSGNAAIYVTMIDGRRKPVRIGKVGRQRAERIRGHIAELEAANLRGIEPVCVRTRTGRPSSNTRAWLAEAKPDLRDKLAGARLCEASQRRDDTLGAFIDGYLSQRADLKPGTLAAYRQARRHLVRFMGEAKPLASITPADADAYRADLLSENRARATVNKWCRLARQFLDVAKRRGIIADNPFGYIKSGNQGNVSRRVFVPAEDVAKVIGTAPDPQWKLLIALGRFGGLRIPSEALALSWRDVDFEHSRFIVRASKTEHHDDGGVRVVPMFPELVEHFRAVFEDAAEGVEHVITRYRNPAGNLRTQLVRYIEAAGLKPWVKPWQNMRASRATELADSFPSHVCAAWLGHIEKIADAFYRTVTDEHFERATKVVREVVRNPVRAGGAQGRTVYAEPCGNRTEPHETVLVTCQVGAEGFEPS